MSKKYFAKILARDSQGLQMISTYCSGAEVNTSDIKYLKKNKIFLFSLKRSEIESDNKRKKINSICKFEFVDNVKSKGINQNNLDKKLELIVIDYLKDKNNYEINLIFTSNVYISLSTEIIEVTFEDQNEILND